MVRPKIPSSHKPVRKGTPNPEKMKEIGSPKPTTGFPKSPKKGKKPGKSR